MSRLPILLPAVAVLYLTLLIACDAQGQPVVTIAPEQVQEIATAVAREGVEIPDASSLAPAVQATLTAAEQAVDQQASAGESPAPEGGDETRSAGSSPSDGPGGETEANAESTAVPEPTPTPAPVNRAQPPPPNDDVNTDREALTAIYEALGGVDWKNQGGWLTEEDLNDWYGVVTNDQGRVVELDIRATGAYGSRGDNGLSGAIPPDIGNLTALTRLTLSQNEGLTGPLPPELSNLANLEELHLDRNPNLTGELPWELSLLTGLQVMDLSNTALSGPVPAQFENLSGLPTYKYDPTGRSHRTGDFTIYNTGLCIPPELEETLLPRVQRQMAGPHGNTPFIQGVLCHQREALEALYRGLGGENWQDSNNWLNNLPLNDWGGVSTDESGRVTELDLRSVEVRGAWGDNGLSGPVPAEIGDLTALIRLDLSLNENLTGPLPPELGNLPDLEELYLQRNPNLDGELPAEVGQLVNLKIMLLHDTGLSGPLPLEMANLANLNESNYTVVGTGQPGGYSLRIQNSGLCVPPELAGTIGRNLQRDVQVGNGRTVEDFYGVHCEDKEALEAIYRAWDGDNWEDSDNWLSNRRLNEWHGVETDHWGRVTSLDFRSYGVRGSVGDNLLKGPIPREITRLDELRHLVLSHNAGVTGPVPPELGSLAKLETLALNDTGLSGPLPPELGNLTNFGNYLTYANTRSVSGLNLSNVGLCIPPELESSLVPIIPYQAGEVVSDIYGVLCEERAKLAALHAAIGSDYMADQGNWLSNKTLHQWWGVETNHQGKVTGLKFTGGYVSGTIPGVLGQFTHLESLDLRRNPDLTGCIPANLQAQLTTVEVGELEFCGAGVVPVAPGPTLAPVTPVPPVTEVPPSDQFYVDRVVLELLYNEMGGPDWRRQENWLSNEPLGGWQGVATDGQGRVIGLSLHSNGLSGRLSVNVGRLTKLRELRLQGNQLTGPVPATLKDLPDLELVNLSLNRLDGTIPAYLAEIATLNTLWLHDNQFTGCTPAALRGLVGEGRGALPDFCADGNPPPPVIPQITPVTTDHAGDRAALLRLFEAAHGASDPNPNRQEMQSAYDNIYPFLTPGYLREVGVLTREDATNFLNTANLADLGKFWQLVADNNANNRTLQSSVEDWFNRWNIATNWNTEGSIRFWHGVTVTGERVTALSLPNNNLAGDATQILHAAGALTELERLDLSNNDLRGEIPWKDLPVNSDALPKLRQLKLGGNPNLTGCIPDVWVDQLTGDTGFPFCGAEKDRATLIAFYNAAGGPKWDLGNVGSGKWDVDNLGSNIGRWHGVTVDPTTGRVTRLELPDNNVHENIPAVVGDLSALTYLDLSATDRENPRNHLGGAIPPELDQLTQLTYLDLSGNALRGSIKERNADHPRAINWNNLQNLEYLDLSHNKRCGGLGCRHGLSGWAPWELGRLPRLGHLDLSDNEFQAGAQLFLTSAADDPGEGAVETMIINFRGNPWGKEPEEYRGYWVEFEAEVFRTFVKIKDLEVGRRGIPTSFKDLALTGTQKGLDNLEGRAVRHLTKGTYRGAWSWVLSGRTFSVPITGYNWITFGLAAGEIIKIAMDLAYHGYHEVLQDMKSIVNHRWKQALYESCLLAQGYNETNKTEKGKRAIRHSCWLKATE
ncbi:MAG: hypothetical protein OXI91_14875 [Chloroflexota bacterium]|nr:hypothetical protein [Chloroflexota bacterium]